MSRIRVTHVNHATLSMFGAKSENELLANLDKIFRDEMRAHFRTELMASWNGDKSWSGDGTNYRLDGEALHIRLHWRILPECESTWECVLVSIENITALKTAEQRFHDLFMHAPISLWEEDYSGIKKEFDVLRAQGIVDLKAHLAAHPKAVDGFMILIRATSTTLSLHTNKSRTERMPQVAGQQPRSRLMRCVVGHWQQNQSSPAWTPANWPTGTGCSWPWPTRYDPADS